MLLKNFYFAAARETPGCIYRVQDGVETVRYRRSKGRIYSTTFSPDGLLHYVSANEDTIYRVRRILWFEFSSPVLTHSTYIRDLAFDSGGSLYFSEASGAGGDGRIYRRDAGAATVLWREVPLSAVGGFWSGDFALDARGDLFISSGNRVPASIYRCRGGTWSEVYGLDEPIKGLSVLATDLLVYTNWRSEIYLLDLRDNTRELVYANPARLWLSDVALQHPQIEEDTLYEGGKIYTCDGTTCWRDDGSADDTWDFVDKDANTPEIAAMLADIGTPTTPTENDTEIWSRTRTVWAWMQGHGLGPGDPNFAAAQEYRAGLDDWPTVAQFAYMFAHFGGFNWTAGCTCMCRAQTFATLLYRAGIPVNRMAIAEARWKPSYSQHMYIVLQLDGHWYYVDPSANTPELPPAPANVASGGTADYTHPNSLTVIPGSTLTKPMLVR